MGSDRSTVPVPDRPPPAATETRAPDLSAAPASGRSAPAWRETFAPETVLALQRTAGNRAVSSILGQESGAAACEMTSTDAEHPDDALLRVLAEAAAARRADELSTPSPPPAVPAVDAQGLLNTLRSLFLSLQSPESVPAQLMIVHQMGAETDEANRALVEHYARGNTGPDAEARLRELQALLSGALGAQTDLVAGMLSDFGDVGLPPLAHHPAHAPGTPARPGPKRGPDGTPPDVRHPGPPTPPSAHGSGSPPLPSRVGPPARPPGSGSPPGPPEPFVPVPHPGSPDGHPITKLSPVAPTNKERRALSFDEGATANPNSMLDPSRTSGHTAEAPLPEGTSVRSWKQQGREERPETLEFFLNDPNQPAHVLGWLRNEQRRLSYANGKACMQLPPGYVLGHLPGKRASEGFDYTNSTIVTKDIDLLESRTFPKWRKRTEQRKKAK